MKKLLAIAFIAVLTFSCQSKVAPTDIPKINGYWEIEKVVFPDGNEKEYSINEVYDYFEIKNNKGIRKKVMPQLDGTFLVNDTFETIEVKESNGKYSIHCNTAFAKWQEEIVSLTDKELVLLNPSKKEYHYKRATPINIIPNGKKTQ
ncbi:lipocalin family protein [Flavobacterium sp.]|uniref:lipocalin family protein n=1 Tax=Flavobacterium sp. TaxID=239 RepID=UPI00286A172F|nr:lipocalin family protein [Flavobacterium sp.]